MRGTRIKRKDRAGFRIPYLRYDPNWRLRLQLEVLLATVQHPGLVRKLFDDYSQVLMASAHGAKVWIPSMAASPVMVARPEVSHVSAR